MSSTTKVLAGAIFVAVFVLLVGYWSGRETMHPDRCKSLGGVVVKGLAGDWVCISKSAVLQ